MFEMKIRVKLPESVIRALSPDALSEKIVERSTKAVGRLVRDNFRKLDRERTVHGSHFYESKGVNATDTIIRGNRGVVSVNSYEMAHKLLGGVVKPKRVKFLAIPAADPYFGSTPREFGKGKYSRLKFRKTRKGGLLYEAKNPDRVAYWLVKQVKHRPRPETLPTKKAIIDACRQAAVNYLDGI